MARYGEISGSRKGEVGIEFRIDIQALTKGVEQQMQRLIKTKINIGLKNGLQEFGRLVVEDIKSTAPAQHLKEDVEIYKVVVKSPGNYALGIRIGAPDARAWEFGSGIHSTKKEPQKYWIYAKGARGEGGARLLSFEWEKAKSGRFVGVRVHHPGIKASPYIYPALRRQLRHVNQIMIRSLRSA